MMPHMYNPVPTVEVRLARSRAVGFPPCDALRCCAAVLLLVQHAIPTRFLGFIDLDLVTRLGFALTGYLMIDFLLRDRDGVAGTRSGRARNLGESWIDAIQRIVPLPYLFLALAASFYLPGIEALAGLRSLELPDFLDSLDRNLAVFLADFERLSIEGWFRVTWPMIALLAPRRMFLPIILALLASGPMSHFWSLSTADVHPASILVAPSAFDLLAAGAFLAMALPRGHLDGVGRVSRFFKASLMIAAASVGSLFWDRCEVLGSIGLFKAPAGFGLGNFLLEITSTMLIASLVWQTVPRRCEKLKGAHAN